MKRGKAGKIFCCFVAHSAFLQEEGERRWRWEVSEITCQTEKHLIVRKKDRQKEIKRGKKEREIPFDRMRVCVGK
jgi:hypothetical protein